MSHLVTIRTQVRDPVAVEAACRRLQLPAPAYKTVQLFSATATGLAVELPGWKYPVVCQTETGELRYDNYEGRWGDQEKLGRLLQMYAVEKAKIEARKKGHCVTEQARQDGSIVLQIVT